MAEGRASRMYKDSPKLSRGDSGHMEVTRKKSEHMEKHGGTAGTEEPIPAHLRHAHERDMLHAKHQHEHMMADHHGHDKSEMHGRHEKEHMDMHARHASEGATGGEMIDKVESNKGE